MARTHIPGFPRLGAHRELLAAQTSFWRAQADTDAVDESGEAALREVGAALRARHWRRQREAGLDFVCVGDFAWYDPMLSLTALLGAPPARFGFAPRTLTLAQYYALARGNAAQPAMATTRWFDTSCHYVVPELGPDTRFDGGASWFFEEIDEALALGLPVKPVLIGPLTYLWFARGCVEGFDRLALLPRLLVRYARILDALARRGIEWVELDEPALGTDLDPAWLAAFGAAYEVLGESGVKVLLATGFGAAHEHADCVARLPVRGVHVDLVQAPAQLDTWRVALRDDQVLSAGVIDGRNVWRADLARIVATLRETHAQFGERLWIAPSCSLAHVPVTLDGEHRLDAGLRSWLAFASEKLDEVAAIALALRDPAAAQPALDAASAALARRCRAGAVVNALVQRRVAAAGEALTRRISPFAHRREAQRRALRLPLLPTMAIGALPQTGALREARAACRRGELRALDYLERLRAETAAVVRRQQELGLDVLTHGELGRDDAVEYFAEQLWGFALTLNGWVQRDGARCVKPPILYGDVYRAEPMTVDALRYAQSLTAKPVKATLSGPLTLLQGAFVRDDQPREVTALQLALAIRDEVAELEQAGARIVEIDESAFGACAPLRRAERDAYFAWAARVFRVASSGVTDATQIQAYLGHAMHDDWRREIAALDADVITLGAAQATHADALAAYPNALGLGVCDVRVCDMRAPEVEAVARVLERACEAVPVARLWVSPGGALGAWDWPAAEAVLGNMVSAAHALRARLASQAAAAA